MLSFQLALASDAALLSTLAFASKSHWLYSAAQLQRWTQALQVAPSDIVRWPTVTARLGETVVGFYQLRTGFGESSRLEHFWLLPEFMGKGFGRRMFADVVERARALKLASFIIESDPNAEMFYLACGARRVGEVPAPMEGAESRVLPLLEMPVERRGGEPVEN
jgi:GNAT superfamily N-acetyltransferase